MVSWKRCYACQLGGGRSINRGSARLRGRASPGIRRKKRLVEAKMLAEVNGISHQLEGRREEEGVVKLGFRRPFGEERGFDEV